MQVTLSNDGASWSDRAATFRYTETSASQCIATGPGVGVPPASLYVGAFSTFTISARTAQGLVRENGGDQFYVALLPQFVAQQPEAGVAIDLDRDYDGQAALGGALDEAIQPQLYDAPDLVSGGRYFAFYNVTVSGMYFVEVMLSGVNISSSPFAVREQWIS